MIVSLILGSCAILGAQTQTPAQPATPMAMDCSTMSMEMQQFASQLNPSNKMMFCGKFNDTMRGNSMQASAGGMTPDQAVQKVATDNNMMVPKSAGGCPVK